MDASRLRTFFKDSAKRAGKLFDFGRNRLRTVMGLLDSPGVLDANRHLKQPHLLFVT